MEEKVKIEFKVEEPKEIDFCGVKVKVRNISLEDYSTIPTTNEENELITLLDETVDRAFIDAVKEQVIRQDIIDKVGKDMKIIFTPIHGTGNLPIRRVLSEVGFESLGEGGFELGEFFLGFFFLDFFLSSGSLMSTSSF